MIILLMFQLLMSREEYTQTRDIWQQSKERVRYDTLVGWISRPNLDVMYEGAGQFKTRVRTDSEGFRRNPYPSRSNIVLVGDSFCFGWGVEDNQTAAYWMGAYNVS